MAEKGVVTELKNNLAIISMTRTEACAKCRACIAGMTEKEMIMEAENHCDAKVGDWVELEMIEGSFFFAVMVMYGIPLVCFMIGLLVSYFVVFPQFFPTMNADLPSFGIALVCTGLAYLGIRTQESRWEAKKYRPIAARLATDEKETM